MLEAVYLGLGVVLRNLVDNIGDSFGWERCISEVESRSELGAIQREDEIVIVSDENPVFRTSVGSKRLVRRSLPEFRFKVDMDDIVTIVFESVSDLVFNVFVKK
ncbi:hypothetical protein GJ631_00710 [Natronomonas sp. CBA1123]|nr:hypothetical protein [Natronomonas sp. CBA1123]MUV85137.1 hypothetical protein [Natronomonas sp. CBA1123]